MFEPEVTNLDDGDGDQLLEGTATNPHIILSDDPEQPSSHSQNVHRTYLTAAAGSIDVAIDVRDGSNDREGSVEYLGQITREDYLSDAQLRCYLRDLERQEQVATETRLNQRQTLATYHVGASTISPGSCVELKDGSFMRIHHITKNGIGDVFIAGDLLALQSFQELVMPNRRCEAVLLQQISEERFLNKQPVPLQETSTAEILRTRKIIFTSHRYPDMSRQDLQSGCNRDEAGFATLFCRWKRVVVKDARGRVVEEEFKHLLYADADETEHSTKRGFLRSARIADADARRAWRQMEDSPGGSHESTQQVEIKNEFQSVNVKQYTFGDAFCGAGGASCGAAQAGLHVAWGFDHDEEAMGTFSGNFPGAAPYLVSAEDFICKICHDAVMRVDVLHMSPPCQPFSWSKVHMTPQQDEANEACLFSIRQLLENVRPRVATLEQTDGLLSKHRLWFCAMIQIFIDLGYSVRWRILHCTEHGVPQLRKRLFIIAAGPGEALPPYAKPTHSSEDPRLLPLVTINDAIGGIPTTAPDHNPRETQFRDGFKPPYDGHTLAHTVTTGGSTNYHPSGQRPFTVRENACLQTFPVYYGFGGATSKTRASRQVGNAVPPRLARAQFRGIVRSLEESDGV